MLKYIDGTDYMISDDGQVYSNKTEKYISNVKNKNGAIKVNLFYERKNHQHYVSRLVADAYLPKPRNIAEEDLAVFHKDYDQSNNKVENLMWINKNEVTKKMHDEKRYVEHMQSLKKRIKLVDRLNCYEVTFESLLEAAIYLKSLNPDFPDVFAIRSNLSAALNGTGKVYGLEIKLI